MSQEEAHLQDTAEDRDDSIIGRALIWSMLAIGAILLIAGGVYLLVFRQAATAPVEQPELAGAGKRTPVEATAPRSTFTDITEQAGIDFVHENGAYGDKLLPETMGGGCAFFDFDNDGDQDLLLINSTRWKSDPRPAPAAPATMRLYANDGSGKFSDVTVSAGLDVSFYGMGCAVGDYDNDGFEDVFITAVGQNRLFRNVDGKFQDVTLQAGVAGGDDRWSTSCGWFDMDNDGDLDLFVANYLDWSPESDQAQNFQLTGVGDAYGRPENFPGEFPYLYRNEGDGKFTEVAEKAGLHVTAPGSKGEPLFKSLGVTFADFDADGFLDFVVANDTVQNLLFHNQGDGTFREQAALAGIAFDRSGAARGAMGIDVASFRNKDSLGVVIGNYANEMTALYVSQRDEMQFDDEAISTGLGPVTRLALTFGVLFLDYDSDGRLDIFTANGHLEEEINRVQASQQYEQPPQLFWNCGSRSDTEFAAVPAELCGEDLRKPLVGRGAAYADIDNDGDLDLLVTTIGRGVRLLRNNYAGSGNWLRLKLTGATANRSAIGARVLIEHEGETLSRMVMPTRSYLSQVEAPVTFGLGEIQEVKRVVIQWPGGQEQVLASPALNQLHQIQQAK